jgi:hypothetical protein
VKQLPKSVVREIRTLRSVGAGGGRLPPATRWPRAIVVPTPTSPRGFLVGYRKVYSARCEADVVMTSAIFHTSDEGSFHRNGKLSLSPECNSVVG